MGMGRPGLSRPVLEGTATACPRHPGSWVTRNGTAFTASGRLQKYFCQPAGAPRHTFTGPVAGDGRVDRPPRGHRYGAVVIARALLALARGATYRQARITALGGSVPARSAPADADALGLADAKLVSRWLDTFGPVLRRELAPAHAFPVAVARGVPVGGPSVGCGGRWLLCLAGWSPGERPLAWPAILADRPDEAAWQALFQQAVGGPAVLLCGSPAQEAAAVRVWGPHLGMRSGQGSASSRRGPEAVRSRVLGWPAAVNVDLWEARRVAGTADALVGRLAGRVATIRAMDRASVLVGLMALEVSGLATAESLTRIVEGG
jgi:hypothetical protein